MKKHIPVFALLLFSFSVFGQSSKKESLERYRQLVHTDTNQVKNGKQLHLANELSIDGFVTYYIEHGETKMTKKYGTLTLKQLYNDSLFTYYGSCSGNYLVGLIKVNTGDFKKLDLSMLNGDTIRTRFISEIVPLVDKQKVRRREAQSMAGTESRVFKYIYHEKENKILVIYKWKVTGDYIRIIKKTYTALYDLKSGALKAIH